MSRQAVFEASLKISRRRVIILDLPKLASEVNEATPQLKSQLTPASSFVPGYSR